MSECTLEDLQLLHALRQLVIHDVRHAFVLASSQRELFRRQGLHSSVYGKPHPGTEKMILEALHLWCTVFGYDEPCPFWKFYWNQLTELKVLELSPESHVCCMFDD